MDMDNVSKMLKEARLAKGLSLEEAEAATSIRKLYLDAVDQRIPRNWVSYDITNRSFHKINFI